MSHFELKDDNKKSKAVVRFDYYPTGSNSISWKEEVDALPEFDMDYEDTWFDPIIEKKPFGKGDNKVDCYYYPGFTLNI